MGRAQPVGLYDLAKDPGQSNSLDAAQPGQSALLRQAVLAWYHALLAEPHALRMPQFQVGFKGRGQTWIYATAPTDHAPGLVNLDHRIKGWQRAGDWSEYAINVHTPGLYEVYLTVSMSDLEGPRCRMSAGPHSVSGPLAGRPGRPIGTLIRNESAYWQDFGRPETFRPSIRNLRLGTLRLDAGHALVRLEQTFLATATATDPDDQFIAIQLVRDAND